MASKPSPGGSVAQSMPERMLNMFKDQNAFCPADTRMPVRIRPNFRYYHRVAYPAAGTLNIQLFTAAQADFVTNLEQPQTLQRDYWYKVYSMGVRVIAGQGVDGTLNATQANESHNTAAAALPATGTGLNNAQIIAEQMLRVHRNGRVKFGIGDAIYLDRLGLDSLPYGGGPDLSGSLAADNFTTAAATSAYSSAILTTNNGAPMAINQMRFRTPLVIPPLLKFQVQLQYQALIALQGGGVVDFYLEGDLYCPRNQ